MQSPEVGHAVEPIFARATPRSILVKEEYEVRQEISRNRRISVGPARRGSVRVIVPYDGGRHFSRMADRDVSAALRRDERAGPRVDAIIGHLAFANHQGTDLADILGLGDRNGVLPVEIPIRSPENVS